MKKREYIETCWEEIEKPIQFKKAKKQILLNRKPRKPISKRVIYRIIGFILSMLCLATELGLIKPL